MEMRSYGGVRCRVFDDAYEWQKSDREQSDFDRCSVAPHDTAASAMLLDAGFYFLDRRLSCRISLKRMPEGSSRKRFDTGMLDVSHDDMKQVFHSAFTSDRRMQLARCFDDELSSKVLDGYIYDAADMTLISCMYKGSPVGCAYLAEEEKSYFVYLAGVMPKFQGTGAAVELYRACADFAKEHGKRFLDGQISAANTSVMNIYAGLGADFRNAEDWYVLDRRGVNDDD